MALDGTYIGLKASVADFLNRQDLAAAIGDFITMAEAQFNRELRVLGMETFSVGTSAASAEGFGTVGVPTDWLETRTFRIDQPSTGSQILEYVGEEELDQFQTAGLTNTPRYYTIINGEFQILPAPSGNVTYALRYYAKIPALADGTPTNWLLTKSPDLYLYSALVQSAPYLKDDDRVAVWGAIRAKLISDMQYESERAKRSTVRIRTRAATYG